MFNNEPIYLHTCILIIIIFLITVKKFLENETECCMHKNNQIPSSTHSEESLSKENQKLGIEVDNINNYQLRKISKISHQEVSLRALSCQFEFERTSASSPSLCNRDQDKKTTVKLDHGEIISENNLCRSVPNTVNKEDAS